MRIGGLLKFSLIDYPGKVAAVVFTQGCNYRCPFCHNPALVLPELFTDPLVEEDVLAFLEKRKDQLQGVVVTGGEPSIHNDLSEFLHKIKTMGYLVKMDTNGSRPDVLQNILDAKLVDFVAMDIKSSLESYCKATGVSPDLDVIKSSIRIIKDSGVEHEFRTTALKSIVSEEDMAAIKELIGPGQNYVVKRGNIKDKILDYNFFADRPDYTDEEWLRVRTMYDSQ
ncbi:MAG: anaerobic ribonucleoside-triphosphate reductase activating protein [Candidatus Omnitrophica bacterium]|nr:anaerobic ribonucleoside-triphosphate reductase activating protein [Candidatus Omnitrophota bacterium]